MSISLLLYLANLNVFHCFWLSKQSSCGSLTGDHLLWLHGEVTWTLWSWNKSYPEFCWWSCCTTAHLKYNIIILLCPFERDKYITLLPFASAVIQINQKLAGILFNTKCSTMFRIDSLHANIISTPQSALTFHTDLCFAACRVLFFSSSHKTRSLLL